MSSADFANLGFQQLSSIVHYLPAKAKASVSPKYDLLLLCGWMNAPTRSLLKYYTLHQSIQPNVPVLFIESLTSSVLGFETHTLIALRPALDVVCSLPPEPRIFVATFSNGGCLTLIRLLIQYHSKTGQPMPIKALVIDSAPGGSNFPEAYTRTIKAFMSNVTKTGLIWYPTWFLISTALLILFLIPPIFGVENPLSRIRRCLNDDTFLDKRCLQGYIYCKGDQMVGWEDIETHAREATDHGWTVIMKGFDGGSHVAGFRHHPIEYEAFIHQIQDGT